MSTSFTTQNKNSICQYCVYICAILALTQPPSTKFLPTGRKFQKSCNPMNAKWVQSCCIFFIRIRREIFILLYQEIQSTEEENFTGISVNRKETYHLLYIGAKLSNSEKTTVHIIKFELPYNTLNVYSYVRNWNICVLSRSTWKSILKVCFYHISSC